MSQKFVASCVCGQSQVETENPPGWVVNCHCSQCRRALSADYASLCGFNPGEIRVIKGEYNLSSYATGQEERIFCNKCGSYVFARLHHLKQHAIYLSNFIQPNHGPDGKLDPRFKPTAHIFYTSGIINVIDGLPKYVNLPKAFGGSDEKVAEDYHKVTSVL